MATPQVQSPSDVQAKIIYPAEVVAWLAVGLCAGAMLLLPWSTEQRMLAMLMITSTALYVRLYFHWIVPKYSAKSRARLYASSAGIPLLAWASYILAPHGVHMDAFYVLTVVAITMNSDAKASLFVALLATLCDGVVSSVQSPTTIAFMLQLALRGIVYVSAAFLVSSLAGALRKRSAEILKHSTELGFLLDTSATTTSSLDTATVLPALAVKIAAGIPITLCRLCLFDKDRHMLTTLGVHALHALGDWQPVVGEQWLLKDMPRLRAAVDNAEVRLIVASDGTTDLGRNEQQALFPDGIKVVCFLPIIANGAMLGAILVGEARNTQREPFDPDKLSLLRTIAAQLGAVIQNARLHEGTRRQAERYAALIDMGRAISSTLELDDLMELIHQQVSLAIPSDTYFVSLYDQKTGMLDLRILIDNGQRFPRQQVPLGQGLATWVVLKRKPLLVRSLTAEIDDLPTLPIILGEARPSESWLGVPIMAGDSVLGLLAVASYQPYAFNEEDMALLDAVAQQASLALDNAHQHAQVRDQARRDSLTGVSNHGYLLTWLQEAFDRCTATQKPLSLIMLDIDHFKMYNDEYGHVIGDEVLRLTAQTMQAHVMSTDAVGRWGGEEFVVVLPGAAAEDALRVAERFRQSLAGARLVGSHGEAIPKPTVSQGIATYPSHVSSVADLIVLADNMLYLAKEDGRNRIKVAGEPSRPESGSETM